MKSWKPIKSKANSDFGVRNAEKINGQLATPVPYTVCLEPCLPSQLKIRWEQDLKKLPRKHTEDHGK